ncbi:MAG: EAL domain-containing protein [Sulfurimonas sp.]|uniref:EAL domain-containing protein n=1 Tax=Sulfurimonas sp. TaxID=2022749 RepID=UPI0025F2C193|nr:GGDEF domain-containing phosphodiesterase [Sulfurimonas sp.]MCK9490761.1 EAL domain-containing protein [Sulfurimonas sp.]
MSKKTTYKKITAKIILTTLFLTLSAAYIYSEYMKQSAISNLAQIDAKKSSRLVFETLYTGMQMGWNKNDIENIITRLNSIEKNMKVSAYRSTLVDALYGEIEKDKVAIKSNPNLQKAMQGLEILDASSSEIINYYYPVVAKAECLKCHANAKEEDILGVINISFPTTNLKISLTQMINFFVLFIVAFSLIIFLAIFIELDTFLIKPIRNFSDIIKNITTSQDITKRVEVNDNIEELDSIKLIFNSMLDSIERQFYYDNLTSLQNRRKLTEALEHRQHSFLMIINIDSFQEMNDLYGDGAGDILLKEFSNFLQKLIPRKEHLYRLHADEFAYLCRGSVDLKEFLLLAELISEKISKELFLLGPEEEVSLSATIGMSHGTEMLLVNADTALVVAKKKKKNFLLYDESMAMSKIYEKNVIWTKKLKAAIGEDRIEPLFQPIVDVKTKEIIKYESLMRIVDEDGSYIAPFHFLDLAKKNKLYHQLTKIMIEKTFDKFKDSSYLVSINISVEDILNKEIHNLILEKLSSYKMGERVVFELIESEGIENFDEVIKFINEVKSYDAKVSIDDFGTGYSNFEYLMKLKVDYIKIDGSMIKNIDTNKDSELITQTIVDFAKKMKIKTVAEFVYSKNVFDKVAELDVDYAQGYYFGEPSKHLENES